MAASAFPEAASAQETEELVGQPRDAAGLRVGGGLVDRGGDVAVVPVGAVQPEDPTGRGLDRGRVTVVLDGRTHVGAVRRCRPELPGARGRGGPDVGAEVGPDTVTVAVGPGTVTVAVGPGTVTVAVGRHRRGRGGRHGLGRDHDPDGVPAELGGGGGVTGGEQAAGGRQDEGDHGRDGGQRRETCPRVGAADGGRSAMLATSALEHARVPPGQVRGTGCSPRPGVELKARLSMLRFWRVAGGVTTPQGPDCCVDGPAAWFCRVFTDDLATREVHPRASPSAAGRCLSPSG